MGLSSKEPLAVVKEEIIEGVKDSGTALRFLHVSAYPCFQI